MAFSMDKNTPILVKFQELDDDGKMEFAVGTLGLLSQFDSIVNLQPDKIVDSNIKSKENFVEIKWPKINSKTGAPLIGKFDMCMVKILKISRDAASLKKLLTGLYAGDFTVLDDSLKRKVKRKDIFEGIDPQKKPKEGPQKSCAQQKKDADRLKQTAMHKYLESLILKQKCPPPLSPRSSPRSSPRKKPQVTEPVSEAGIFVDPNEHSLDPDKKLPQDAVAELLHLKTRKAILELLREENELLRERNALMAAQPAPPSNQPKINVVPIGTLQAERMRQIGKTDVCITELQYAMLTRSKFSLFAGELLEAVFTKEVLHTSTLTGKPSHATQAGNQKEALDEKKLKAVIAETLELFPGIPVGAIRQVLRQKCNNS